MSNEIILNKSWCSTFCLFAALVASCAIAILIVLEIVKYAPEIVRYFS